jgi:hypothetical protein
VHAHVHFAAVFHTKTLPVLGRSLDRVESGFKPHAGGQNARVFAIVRAFSGVVAYVIFCGGSVFLGFVLQLFRQTGPESAPTLQGRPPTSRGQDAPKKFTIGIPEG